MTAKAYHQIPVNLPDIQKTATTMSFVLFEFVTCFLIHNAGQTFQKYINEVLSDLEFCITYYDDMLIASANKGSIFDILTKSVSA